MNSGTLARNVKNARNNVRKEIGSGRFPIWVRLADVSTRSAVTDGRFHLFYFSFLLLLSKSLNSVDGTRFSVIKDLLSTRSAVPIEGTLHEQQCIPNRGNHITGGDKMPKAPSLVADFSGHKTVKVQIDDMSRPESFENEAERLVNIIAADPYLHSAAGKGKIILILPGLSVLASAILSEFHGRYGYFPNVRWYLRNSETGEFTVSKRTLDLQKLRFTARSKRQ